VNAAEAPEADNVAHQALNDLAGTGLARYRHFLSLVSEFHDAWRAYFTPRIATRAQMSLTDLQTLPRFSFREEPLPQVLERVLAGMLALALPAVALFFAIPILLNRYRIAA
jgi:ABC-2 type transport system permease protein